MKKVSRQVGLTGLGTFKKNLLALYKTLHPEDADITEDELDIVTIDNVFERTSQSLYKSKKVKMPRPELYVIFVGNKGRKPDTISLSQEFFDGADINIEIKAKVIYESDKDNRC